MNNTTQHTPSFHDLKIAPQILAMLDRLSFVVPTPIQRSAIPVAMSDKDIIGIAQTGTGKTLAFGIPMLQKLMHTRGRGLILVPTRELAIQVNETLEKFTGHLGMTTSVLIGGESALTQIISLRKNPRIIVATPGRIIDFVGQQRLRLDDVITLVLDEADRMLDMGFAPQIERILQLVPTERQTMLFSATMPPPIAKMASAYMHDPERIEVARAGTAAELVTQELFIVGRDSKDRLLGRLLDQYSGSVLLFTRTKIGASKVALKLRSMGQNVVEIHADRSLEQRFDAMDGFKSGLYRVLVATDIAARGIDVTGIELVINYDVPDDPDSYVHRIGRTGRAGQKGHAITIATPDQEQNVRAIEKLTGIPIPVAQHPSIPSLEFGAPSREERGHRGDRGGSSRDRRGGRGRSGHGSAAESARPHAPKEASKEQRPAAGDAGEAAPAKRKRRRRRRGRGTSSAPASDTQSSGEGQ